MRKHLTRIAILAVLSIGFISITGAAPAGAVVGANCTSSNVSTTWYNGNWGWYTYLHGCTAVNAVEFANVSTQRVYMVDITRSGAVHFSFAGGGYIYGVYTDYQKARHQRRRVIPHPPSIRRSREPVCESPERSLRREPLRRVSPRRSDSIRSMQRFSAAQGRKGRNA